MKKVFAVILLLLAAPAHAGDEGVKAFSAGLWAQEDGRLYDAAESYLTALKLGIPDEWVPAAEANLCVVSLSIQVDRDTYSFCKGVLRHGGDSGREFPEALGMMLSVVANILVMNTYYDEAEYILGEYDRRFPADMFPDLIEAHQRREVVRAELERVRGRPEKAMEIVARLTREGLHVPDDTPRQAFELQLMQLLRTHLFAMFDMSDSIGARDALTRLDNSVNYVKTSAGLEQLAVSMLCSAYIVGRLPHQDEKKLLDEISLRTDSFLMFLERAHDLNRQRPLLLMRDLGVQVEQCGAILFALPRPIYDDLRRQGFGKEGLAEILDSYRQQRYGDAARKFDGYDAALKAYSHPRAALLAKRLAILRLYLLNPPGRQEPT